MYESQKRANKKWLAENYEQIALKVPKGTKDRLKSYAAAQGMSLTQYIISSCEKDPGRVEVRYQKKISDTYHIPIDAIFWRLTRNRIL